MVIITRVCSFCEELLILLVFKLHGLADFAEVDEFVFGSEGCSADVTGIVVHGVIITFLV